MIRRVIFETLAKEDFFGAMRWYGESQPGLEWKFLIEVHAAVKLLEENPSIGKTFEGPMRRFLINRFPYWLYYQVLGDVLLIVGCVDCRREQSLIFERIQ